MLLLRAFDYKKEERNKERKKEKIKRAILISSHELIIARIQFWIENFQRLRYRLLRYSVGRHRCPTEQLHARFEERARSMCNAGKLISETRFPPKRPTSNIGKRPCPSFGRVPWLQTNERKDLIAPPILFSPTFSPSPAKLLIQSFSNYTTRPRFSPRPLLLRTAALSFRRPPLPALPPPPPPPAPLSFGSL